MDGIPLAIELAARRLTSMTPDELVARFDLCVDLLSGPAGPPRQRTMDSTMDWSFALLSPPAQKLFAALSVCSDGWTLEAAEALGESIGLGVVSVPRIVADFWDQSLLTTDHSTPGKARYGMLTTVRSYASRRLDGDGGRSDVQAGHARFFAAFAHQIGHRPFGADEGSRIRALEDQFDNVRTAFRWCLGRRQWDLGLSILVSLVPELVLRERIEIGRWPATCSRRLATILIRSGRGPGHCRQYRPRGGPAGGSPKAQSGEHRGRGPVGRSGPVVVPQRTGHRERHRQAFRRHGGEVPGDGGHIPRHR